MKTELKQRRTYIIDVYGQTFSEKIAIEATAKKFGVKKNIVYVDWKRRNIWLKDIISFKNSNFLIRHFLRKVVKNLMEIEKLATNSNNDNVRLGAHKLQMSSLFKLIDFYHNYKNEELLERMEKIEEQIQKMGAY